MRKGEKVSEQKETLAQKNKVAENERHKEQQQQHMDVRVARPERSNLLFP